MKKSESPSAARIILGLVAAIAISIPLAITLKSQRDLVLLEKTAQVTDGSVIKKNCENHGKISFSYVVDGHLYKKFETCPGSCEDARVGDRIKVIYSEEKPQLSSCNSLQSGRDGISGDFFSLALVGVLAGIVIVRITRSV